MAREQKKRTCFAFFAGGDACQACALAKKCKSVLISDGFDLAADMLEELVETLPEKGEFVVTDQIKLIGDDAAAESKKKEGWKQLFLQILYGGLDRAKAAGIDATSTWAHVLNTMVTKTDQITTEDI